MSKKKYKNKRLLISLILILIVGALFTTDLLSLIGFLVLGISNPTYQSADSDLSGPAWLMTLSLNGQGMSAYGELPRAKGIIDPDDLSPSGETPSKSFTIEAYLDEQKCVYDISPVLDQSSNRYVYRMSTPRVLDVILDFFNRDSLKAQFISECVADDGLYFQKDNNQYYLVCFPRYKIGLMGSVQELIRTYEATLLLNIDGGPSAETQISTNLPSARLGDIGYAYWGGNLESGLQCPGTSDYEAFYSLDTNGWRTVKDIRYSTYRAYETQPSEVYWDGMYWESFRQCILRWKADQATNSECSYAYNQFANILTYTDPISDHSQTVSGTSSSGQVDLYMNDALFFPVISLKVKAESLGIIQPSAQPEINSLSSLPFKAGDNGKITVAVSNVGDDLGAFSVAGSCTPSDFTISYSKRIDLQAGESITTSLILNCDTTSEISGACAVTVSDLNDPTQYDTKNVLVSCSAQQSCTPGEQECEAGIEFGDLVECNEYGSGWVVIEKESPECEVQVTESLFGLPDILGVGSGIADFLDIDGSWGVLIMYLGIALIIIFLAMLFILPRIPLGGVIVVKK